MRRVYEFLRKIYIKKHQIKNEFLSLVLTFYIISTQYTRNKIYILNFPGISLFLINLRVNIITL